MGFPIGIKFKPTLIGLNFLAVFNQLTCFEFRNQAGYK